MNNTSVLKISCVQMEVGFCDPVANYEKAKEFIEILTPYIPTIKLRGY